jgi:hypothetical protein
MVLHDFEQRNDSIHTLLSTVLKKKFFFKKKAEGREVETKQIQDVNRVNKRKE